MYIATADLDIRERSPFRGTWAGRSRSTRTSKRPTETSTSIHRGSVPVRLTVHQVKSHRRRATTTNTLTMLRNSTFCKCTLRSREGIGYYIHYDSANDSRVFVFNN